MRVYSPLSAAMLGMSPVMTDAMQRALIGLVTVSVLEPAQGQSGSGGWDYAVYQQAALARKRKRKRIRDEDEALLLTLLSR